MTRVVRGASLLRPAMTIDEHTTHFAARRVVDFDPSTPIGNPQGLAIRIASADRWIPNP